MYESVSVSDERERVKLLEAGEWEMYPVYRDKEEVHPLSAETFMNKRQPYISANSQLTSSVASISA
jgi:hypothetical protein